MSPEIAQGSEPTVAAPVIKVATAWVAVGITSWAEAAAFAAFIYTCALLAEWIWKKLRPFAERRGWITRVYRRKGD